MYPETKTWNPFAGCNFDCIYCEPSFKRQLKRVGGNPSVRQGTTDPKGSIGEKGGCTFCSSYTPHYHPERLENNSIPSSPIVFVFGTGDISFCEPEYVRKTIKTIKKQNTNTQRLFYFQSKNPKTLEQYIGEYPENTILLTTIETNRDKGYDKISKAPKPSRRFRDFLELDYPRKVLTIEPILDFDIDIFTDWVKQLHDQGYLEYVWIGYNSKKNQVTLPDPDMTKVVDFIRNMKQIGVQVRGKDLRSLTESSSI